MVRSMDRWRRNSNASELFCLSVFTSFCPSAFLPFCLSAPSWGAENDHPTAWPQEEHPDWNDSQKTVLYPRPLSYCHMSLSYEEERAEEFEWVAEGWTSLGRGREARRPKREEERSKIRFVRNDHLSMPDSAVEFEAPWFEKIREWGIAVLILNTGAHAVEDLEFESRLEATFKALRETYPELTVIYRDTPQGTQGGGEGRGGGGVGTSLGRLLTNLKAVRVVVVGCYT